MTSTRLPSINLRTSILGVFPLALWALLWLGIGKGTPESILQQRDLIGLANNIRSVAPIAARSIGLLIIFVRLWRRDPSGLRVIGPLGLVTVYGLVGIFSSFMSPNGMTSLYWTLIYLAVPITLLAIVWGPNPIDRLRPVINLTWIVIILATAALFTIALLELNLASVFTDPWKLLECKGAGWYDITSGRLRETGVGRYAAITALIAFAGLWQKNWRLLFIVIFVASSLLLLSTGARGSFLGFASGLAIICLAYRSKRMLAVGLISILVIVPLSLVTGVHKPFLDNCMLRGWVNLDKPKPGLPILVQNIPPIERSTQETSNKPLEDTIEKIVPVRASEVSENNVNTTPAPTLVPAESVTLSKNPSN